VPADRDLRDDEGSGSRLTFWEQFESQSPIVRFFARVAMLFSSVLLLAALAALVIYVRLQQGPVSLKFMTGPIEKGISGELRGLTATVDDALLQIAETGDYEFRLVNLRLREADGSVVASAPIAAVGLDFAQLATLEVLPRRVDLIEPRLAVTYSQRDGLSLSFTEPDGRAPTGPQPPTTAPAVPSAADPAPASPSAAFPAMLRKLDLARVVAEYTARARRQEGATGSLTQIGLRNAIVDVDYSGQRSRWKVAEAGVDLDHSRRRSVISALARIESDRGPWTLSLLTEDSEKTGTLTIKGSVRDLVPSSLGRAFPNLAMLRSLDLPVAGNAAINFQTSGDLTGAEIAVELSRGLIDLGPALTAPMLIDAGLLTFNYDAASERLTMAPSTVKWGESVVTLTGLVSNESAAGGPSSWAFDIRSVSGSMAAEEFGVPPVPLDAFTLSGRFLTDENRIELTTIEARAGGGELVLAGDIVAGDGPKKGARLEGRFGPATADVVKALWPRMMAPRAREWVGGHLNSGVLQEGKVGFASGAFAGPGAFMARGSVPETVTIDLSGANVTLLPLKGGPPLSAPAISVQIRNQSMDLMVPDAILKTSENAGVALKQGRLLVPDIDAPIPNAEISFRAQSPLAPALDALTQLQFAGASKITLPTDKIQGKFDGEFTVKMPLLPEMEPETVAIIGKAKITDVKSREKIGIINVQSGSVDVRLDETQAVANGDLILNGVLAKIEWRKQVSPGAAPAAPLSLKANLDNADRRQLGIDVDDFVSGDVPVTVTFESPEGATPVIRVAADLTPADLSITPLAWKKPRGSAAKLEFDVASGTTHKTELQNFRVTGDTIAVEGWVGLSADQKLQEFKFPSVSLNTVSRLQVTGKRGQRDIWNVTASGSTFDGKDFFRSLFNVGATPAQGAASKKGGVDVSATIDNVLGYSDVGLRSFSMRLSKRGDELTALDARGKLDGGQNLIAILQAEPNGARKIIADTMDAGQALRLVGFYPNMQGGRGRIDVDLDRRGAAEKSGILIIEDFKVLGDPIISEVIGSVEGDGPAIGAATPGRRRVVREVFEFDRMRLPFSVGHGQFAIEDSYLRGPILGATLRGKVDYSAQRVNLGGTYIPLQGLNNALGGIPVLGQILSGPRGEGIFGITFAVQGSMSDPQVVVNPLSLVAPGIFREMFQMTNPSTSVQPRMPAPGDVPPEQRVRSSSSTKPYVPPETVDGWSSDTVVPTKKN
jgi:hypothetical protein